MNKEKILDIAKDMPCVMNHIDNFAYWSWEEVVHFANAIARIEREECAKICDNMAPHLDQWSSDDEFTQNRLALSCADEIRSKA